MGWVAVAVIGQDNNQANVSGLNATSFPHHHAWLSLPAAPPVGPVRNSTAHDTVFSLLLSGTIYEGTTNVQLSTMAKFIDKEYDN